MVSMGWDFDIILQLRTRMVAVRFRGGGAIILPVSLKFHGDGTDGILVPILMVTLKFHTAGNLNEFDILSYVCVDTIMGDALAEHACRVLGSELRPLSDEA